MWLDNVAVQNVSSSAVANLNLTLTTRPHLSMPATAYKPRLRIKIWQTPGYFHFLIYIDSLYSEPFSDSLGCMATPSAEDSAMAISHRRLFIIDQDTHSNLARTLPTGNGNMVRDEGPIRGADLCSVPGLGPF